ncbi:hypothetical protein FACS189494_00870 [Spirochaetia bacterium]|nr:hypothetical protein FACS189494_00870 [Spirochaetia bacterium]
MLAAFFLRKNRVKTALQLLARWVGAVSIRLHSWLYYSNSFTEPENSYMECTLVYEFVYKIFA